MRISDLIQPGVGQPAPGVDFKQVRLFIAIPTRGVCATQFAVSIARSVAVLTHLGADCQFWRGESDCCVDFNRNRLLAEFIKQGFTHLWMVDDDMGFDPSAIIGMLRKDKDFIAAAGPKKGDTEEYAVKLDCNPDETPIQANGLLRASMVGGAFMLLKRQAVLDVMAYHVSRRCSFVDEEYGYSLFQHSYTRTSFVTEDYTFCQRWLEAGKEIWIYPNVDFTHTGIKEWRGNLHNQLLAAPKPDPAPTMGRRTTIDDLIERIRSGEIKPKAAPRPIAQELLQ